MFYVVLLVAMLAAPFTAFADVDLELAWQPVTEVTDGRTAQGILSHYKLYVCDAPISDNFTCEGDMQTFDTGPVRSDGSGFLEGVDTVVTEGGQLVHVEFEDFDAGKEGETWHDVDSGNNYDVHHAKYRNDPIDVDIRCFYWPGCKTGDVAGYQLGNGSTGEWQRFTVDIPKSGEYTPAVRVTHGRTDTIIMTMEVNGVSRTFTHAGGTRGWDSHAVIESDPIRLEAGTYQFKFTNTAGPMDSDWWELRPVGGEGVEEILFPVTYQTDKTTGPLFVRAAAIGVEADNRSELSNQVSEDIADLIEEEPADTLAPAAPVLRVVP